MQGVLKTASLYFYYGAMGSAKTAQAIITAYNYEERGQTAVCMKPMKDSRTRNKLWSRLGINRDALLLSNDCDPKKIVVDIMTETKTRIDVVIVDEVQFLTPEQIWQLASIVDDLDIPVLCFGLRADAFCNLFPGSETLLAIADKIIEVKTMCHCGKKATISARIHNGKIVREGEQVKIGSNKDYIALCRKCYMNDKLDKEDIHLEKTV